MFHRPNAVMSLATDRQGDHWIASQRGLCSAVPILFVFTTRLAHVYMRIHEAGQPKQGHGRSSVEACKA